MTSWVWGMMFTPKRLPSTSFTVSEMPSTAIEPLGAMKRASSAGASNTKRTLPPSGVMDDDLADAVDMAGDDVAAELVAQLAATVRG